MSSYSAQEFTSDDSNRVMADGGTTQWGEPNRTESTSHWLMLGVLLLISAAVGVMMLLASMGASP